MSIKNFLLHLFLILFISLIMVIAYENGLPRLPESDPDPSTLVPDDMTEVHIMGVLNDSITKSPGVMLFAEEPKTVLMIHIGAAEAMAIQLELNHVQPVRPLTVDLMKCVMDSIQAELLFITIDDVADNTYYAKLFVKDTQNRVSEIDCRPSDAMALALRFKAPVYAHKSILSQYGISLHDSVKSKPKKT